LVFSVAHRLKWGMFPLRNSLLFPRMVWEVPMRNVHINDFVRLTRSLPELSLQRGEVGIVRSTWCAPANVYEVEFHQLGQDVEMRALLDADQIEVEDGPLFDERRQMFGVETQIA
jgi:hypothetical protein